MTTSTKRKKKKLLGFFIICSLILCCYFFRHDLLISGLKLFLKKQTSRHFSKPIAYQKALWEKEKIALLGVSLSNEHFELKVDRVEIGLEMDWRSFYLKPRIDLIHPELNITNDQNKAFIPFTLEPFIPRKFYGLKVDVCSGVLQLNAKDTEQRLYFFFKSGKSKKEIGSFYFSYDPDFYAVPTTEVHFSFDQKEIIASLKVGQIESARLLQLASFFYPSFEEGWQNVEGVVEMIASGSFTPDFTFSKFAGLIDAQEIYLSNAFMDIYAQIKTLHGEFTFPPESEYKTEDPFWKQVRASVTIEEGNWVLAEAGMKNVNAHLLLDPSIDPLLALTGEWIQGDKEIPLTMEGKGSIHEDESFWLEIGVMMTPAFEEASKALISLCSLEKQSYITQIEFNHFDIALLEMLSLIAPSTKGNLEGKITGWFTSKDLKKIELENIQIHNFEWKLPQSTIVYSADVIKGEGALACDSSSQWEILSLRGNIGDSFFTTPHFRSPSFDGGFSGEGSLISTVFSIGNEQIETHFDIVKSEGWLRGEQISKESYNPWIETLCPKLQLEGIFFLLGTFNSNKVFLSVQGKDLVVDRPEMTFYTQEMMHPALINYSFAEQKWQAAWTLQNGSIILKKQNLYFDQISSSLELEGELFQVHEIHAASEECRFIGAINWDLEQEIFSLTTSYLEGSLASLSRLLEWKIPAQGSFMGGEESLSLVSKGESLDWKIKGELKDVALMFKEDLSIEKGYCEICFDSKEQLLTLSEISAELLFHDKTYHLYGQAKRKEWWEFDAKAMDENKEIARAVGIAQERIPDELHFAFEKNKTHFLGVKLSISRFIIKDWTSLLALEMTPFFSLEDCPEKLKFLYAHRLLPIEKLPLELKGKLQAKISYEDAFFFEAAVPQLEIKGYPECPFFIKGEKKSNAWTIEQCSFGSHSLNALLLNEKEHIRCSFLNLHSGELDLYAEGIYNKSLNSGSGQLRNVKIQQENLSAEGNGLFYFDQNSEGIQGELNLDIQIPSYEIHTQEAFKWGYVFEKGFWAKEANFFVEKEEGQIIARCFAQQVLFDGKKWMGKKLQIHSLDGLGAFYPKWASFFPQKGIMEVEYIPSESLLKAGCRTELEGNPLYVQLQIDHAKDVLGMVKITDDPRSSGIKCLFKSAFEWESFQGEIAGLEIHFAKRGSQVFLGDLSADFSLLSKYFPKEKRKKVEALKLNSLVQLKGEWDLNSLEFKGNLEAKKFSFLGISFEELHAATYFSPQECILENLSVIDPGCHFLVKYAHLLHETEWTCHVPLILVSELQPSRLKKAGGLAHEIKPFIIKKLSLYDLEGSLRDVSSFKARGKLNFTNAFKKEFNILEIPLDFLKNLGLDLGLFTPVYGEAEFQLTQGKLIFTDLANSYSEGMRSQFYLSKPGSSFLDVQGNLHFDLRMKQNVLLNITEPFTLSVRGSLEKPKYSLVF